MSFSGYGRGRGGPGNTGNLPTSALPAGNVVRLVRQNADTGRYGTHAELRLAKLTGLHQAFYANIGSPQASAVQADGAALIRAVDAAQYFVVLIGNAEVANALSEIVVRSTVRRSSLEVFFFFFFYLERGY
jgi:hypothetical protein